MYESHSNLGAFVAELPAADKGVLRGIAQEALLSAGIMLDDDNRYFDALGDPRFTELPGVATAREHVYDTFAALCMGLPAPDRV